MVLIQRIVQRVRRRAAVRQARRIATVLAREGAYDSSELFLRAILSEFPRGSRLANQTARLLTEHLGRSCTPARATDRQVADRAVELASFWSELAERSGSAYAEACQGDALLSAGRSVEAFDCFLIAFSREPALVHEFEGLRDVAAELGDDELLEYRLVRLRAALGDADSDRDDARELYSELLDEYSEQPGHLDRIRALGPEIERAVAHGDLPRALMRRVRSRTS